MARDSGRPAPNRLEWRERRKRRLCTLLTKWEKNSLPNLTRLGKFPHFRAFFESAQRYMSCAAVPHVPPSIDPPLDVGVPARTCIVRKGCILDTFLGPQRRSVWLQALLGPAIRRV